MNDIERTLRQSLKISFIDAARQKLEAGRLIAIVSEELHDVLKSEWHVNVAVVAVDQDASHEA